MTHCHMKKSASFAAALAMLICLTPVNAAMAVDIGANFDGWNDLNAYVDVSDTSIGTAITNAATGTDDIDRGLPDGDNELYNYGGGGAGDGYSGGDQALINSFLTYSNVVVSANVGLVSYDIYYGSEGAGVVAGMASGGGSGYLLYLADSWYHGDGYFVDSNDSGGLLQLVLTRKEASMNTPLNGATLYDTHDITTTDAGDYGDQPHHLKLTIDGTSVTGEVWLNQTDDTGDADATVSFVDNDPLSGHVGVYLAIGHYGSNPGNLGTHKGYRENYGVAAVDDFYAAELVPAPEPATLGLMALGAAGLLAARRRASSLRN